MEPAINQENDLQDVPLAGYDIHLTDDRAYGLSLDLTSWQVILDSLGFALKQTRPGSDDIAGNQSYQTLKRVFEDVRKKLRELEGNGV